MADPEKLRKHAEMSEKEKIEYEKWLFEQYKMAAEEHKGWSRSPVKERRVLRNADTRELVDDSSFPPLLDTASPADIMAKRTPAAKKFWNFRLGSGKTFGQHFEAFMQKEGNLQTYVGSNTPQRNRTELLEIVEYVRTHVTDYAKNSLG
jgi:hypothetical protein